MEMESNAERKERIQLIREVKISELILASKINELNNEKNRTGLLKKDIEDIKNKNNIVKENIEKLKEEIKNIIKINENIEAKNNIKIEKRQTLFEELKIGEPQPINDQEKDKDDQDDFEDDYEIEES